MSSCSRPLETTPSALPTLSLESLNELTISPGQQADRCKSSAATIFPVGGLPDRQTSRTYQSTRARPFIEMEFLSRSLFIEKLIEKIIAGPSLAQRPTRTLVHKRSRVSLINFFLDLRRWAFLTSLYHQLRSRCKSCDFTSSAHRADRNTCASSSGYRFRAMPNPATGAKIMAQFEGAKTVIPARFPCPPFGRNASGPRDQRHRQSAK